jgi:DHA2 family multidrug resistance protein
VFLEEGHRKDWLESNLIVSLGSIALVSLITFVILQLSAAPADQPAHPRQPQLRPIEHRQPGHGCGAVRFDLPVAAVSGADPGLQRLADRRGDHVDGVPQLFLIPLVPLLMKVISPKLLCALGFACSVASFSSGCSTRTSPGRSSTRSR